MLFLYSFSYGYMMMRTGSLIPTAQYEHIIIDLEVIDGLILNNAY